MNHLILTTSLSRTRKERFWPNTLVPLQRMVSIRDKSECASHSLRNCLLTILCRESLRYHRNTSILSKREMIHWCPNQIFLKRNTIALVVILTVTVITMIRLHMLIHILTHRRGLTFMVYLMVPLGNITLFVLILLQQVLPPLLSHLLICGWLKRTNSSAGLCLRWI